MDGTLLDRHFDDHFWAEFLPLRYAQARGIPLEEARAELSRRYRAEEGTLNWYDVDFWSEELGLDIMALKRQVEHLVAVHPHVVQFLLRVRGTGRRLYLVTNAHGRTLAFKLERTALAGHFHGIVTSHDLGFPKETDGFWRRLGEVVPFRPEETLLAEDTPSVLEAAVRHGVGHPVFVARPSSTLPPVRSPRFFSIHGFDEIMPP
jgi:putative hydrolase of the HAD superfamily